MMKMKEHEEMSPNREKQNMNSPLSFLMMWAETEVDVTATVYLH